jgi:hypothetical protein
LGGLFFNDRRVAMVEEAGADGGTMDDEKTIIEKLTDAVKGAANSIMDAASNVAETGIKSNAARMSAGDEQVAWTANEQILIPGANDAAAMPIPFILPKAARKKRKTPAQPASAKISRKKAVARKARKSAPKKAKSRAGRKAATKKTVTRKKSVAKKKKTKKS